MPRAPDSLLNPFLGFPESLKAALFPVTQSERELETKEAKLERLMREHSPRVLGYAYHRGASASEAEDVAAEVFLVCWRRLDEVPSRALPWLLGVARKVLANQRRSQHRREALQTRLELNASSPYPGWGSDTRGTEESADMLLALCQLDDADQEALLLTAWEGFDQKEAAQILGCNRAALTVRLYRARARLLKCFEDIRTSREKETTTAQGERP